MFVYFEKHANYHPPLQPVYPLSFRPQARNVDYVAPTQDLDYGFDDMNVPRNILRIVPRNVLYEFVQDIMLPL